MPNLPALRSFACALLFLAVSLAAAAEPSADSPRKALPWTSLESYGVDVPALHGGPLTAILTPGSSGFNSLEFQLNWIVQGADTGAFNDSSLWKVRLHYRNGRVVESGGGGLPCYVSSCLTGIRTYVFPYSDNSLTEAWVEVHIGKNTCWFEIPYGFTRDPGAPLPPSDPKAAPAGFAPAMKDSPKDAQIVRWQTVRYDFGPIQKGWKLEADIKNSGYPLDCLIHLQRPNGKWEFHNPIIKMKVEKDTGGIIDGEQFAERLSDGYLREDEFSLRFPPLTGRGWATLVVTINDKPHRGVISLGTFLPGMWIDPWKK